MLKKIICIALTLIMVLTLFVTATSSSAYFELVSLKIDFYEENGWTVYYCVELIGPVDGWFTKIDNYVFRSTIYNVPYSLGVYVQKSGEPYSHQAYMDGEILNLDKAYEQGIITDMESLIDAMESHPSYELPSFIGISGDANENGEIDITDSLEVQKVLAGMKLLPFEQNEYVFYLYNYDFDYNITVKDVLGIQKELASLV